MVDRILDGILVRCCPFALAREQTRHGTCPNAGGSAPRQGSGFGRRMLHLSDFKHKFVCTNSRFIGHTHKSSPICIGESNGVLWLIHILLACGAALQ
jgi:hypothetical protein